jgi:hypothetical protein
MAMVANRADATDVAFAPLATVRRRRFQAIAAIRGLRKAANRGRGQAGG